jgi:hypothetical protein
MYAITEANGDPWYFSHTATWIYNNADVTGTDYYKTRTDLPAGLLTSGASDFYVTVTNSSSGCKTRMINVPYTFRSAKLTDEADATNSVVDEEMKVSPNPSTGRIKVTLPTDESTNISLYDLKGSLLKTWTNQPAVSILDISDLESGNYFVVAHQNGKRYSKKIILTK